MKLSVLLLLLKLKELNSIEYMHGAPYLCLGSYQLCDTGDCVLVDEHCGRCASQQYLCPDMQSCLDDVKDYEKCPNIKGTHFDWTMEIEKRLDYLVNVTTLDEKYRQLTHDAPGIARLGISPYNWLNDNQHGVRNPHSTSFPNGCAIGASWSKQATRKIAAKIAYESRSVFNDLTNIGVRGTGLNWGGGGSTITIYAPNLNLVRDPRWGRAQEVFTEDPNLSSQLEQIQAFLLEIGSHIATPRNSSPQARIDRTTFDEKHATTLESWIDAMDQKLPPLTNFILPSGGKTSSFLHVCRAICRRAERSIVSLSGDGSVDQSVTVFINRLSDFFFMSARYAAQLEGKPETIFKKPKT